LLRGRRLRRYPSSDSNHFTAGSVDRTPNSRSNSRQERCSVSCAFLGLEDLDFVSIRVCLDLPPQGRARSAATQSNGSYRNAHLGKEGERVLQTESHAFENRANYVPARVGRSQAN
jgi:hypothetical protein